MRKNLTIAAWLLVAPALIIRLFTAMYPMAVTFYYSMLDYSLIKGKKVFIGFGNFLLMWGDNNFLDTLRFTLIFTIVSLVLHVVLGIALGMLLNVKFRGKKFLRSVVLLPWAIPMIVMGVAAQWMFNGQYGLVNDILYRFLHIRPEWLVEVAGARFAVIATDVWKSTPFFAIMVLAGLQTISNEVYEAATIDGANKWGLFRKITIPHISRLVMVLVIYFALWRLTSFDLVYAITGGGPGASTSLLSYRIYVEAFKNLNFGYASSISVVLFLVMAVIAGGGFYAMRKTEGGS